tara:strand:- start:1170 stop:1418 length:249 start_codon:yes stop_codon:yes gene_type:complete
MSMQAKVLTKLQTGKAFTASQFANLFKSTEATVAARISDLRKDGYAIYSNRGKNGKTSYRIGSPSRAMVAAAYNSAGSSVFS